MPPKKAAKGKKGAKGSKKKKEAADDGGVFQVFHDPNTLLRRYESVIQAMERELEERTVFVQKQRAATEEMKIKVMHYEGDLLLERSDKAAVVTDFSRVYKARQDELCEKINDLENAKAELLDQIELQRLAMEELKKETVAELELKDRVIAEQKIKIAAVTEEFQEMLKDTLNRLVDKVAKIEESSGIINGQNHQIEQLRNFMINLKDKTMSGGREVHNLQLQEMAEEAGSGSSAAAANPHAEQPPQEVASGVSDLTDAMARHSVKSSSGMAVDGPSGSADMNESAIEKAHDLDASHHRSSVISTLAVAGSH